MKNYFAAASILWTIIWWFIAWSRIPILSEYSFFPLWIGYIASINTASNIIFENSLLKKMGLSFIWLFIISIPMWWGFEYLNTFVQNWHYIFARPVSPIHFNIQASIDFSTVIPAVLSTSFFFQQWLQRKNLWKNELHVSKACLTGLFLFGAIFLLVVVYFPNQTFPLIWVAPLLLLDPINYLFGFPSILKYIETGKWSVPITAMSAALFCGFWWEMWNFYSLPKWYYTIPYVGFWKVFEMPILGYGGYLFFGMIVLSFTFFIISTLAKFKIWNVDARIVLADLNS